MRHLASANILSVLSGVLLSAFLIAVPAVASPVYLRPDSRFSSGTYPRQWLESRTREVQMQRWFKVKTSDQVTGWISEDHLLTALHLTGTAELIRDVPSRSERQVDAIFGRPLLKSRTRVLVLEIAGAWVRAQPLTEGDPREAWLQTQDLKAVAAPGVAARAFAYRSTRVLMQPHATSREVARIPSESFVHVISEKKDWVEVRTASSFGFIPRADLWLASDLGQKGARPAVTLAPMRAAPVPYSETIRSLPLTAKLEISAEKILRWGKVATKEKGALWWPISDEDRDDSDGATPKPNGAVKILTAELFQRKIFDMAASKAIPSLKFASAEGIYRTLDGEEWTKIALFREQNFPIAVTSGGSVFIGPYVSDDHGETFQQWIRWDLLVSSLRGVKADGNRLSILGIKPQDSAGRRVTLTLDIGQGKSVTVLTDDQGMSWRSL